MTEVRDALGEERPWLSEVLAGRFGASVVVSRGERIDASKLPALVAVSGDGEREGLLTYRALPRSLEVVTLDAFRPGGGVGSALLAAAAEVARSAGMWRLWLVTTDDNVAALAFYLKRGMRIAAVYQNAVSWSREVKPSIPLVGPSGVPVRDEIELELLLD